ncbi:MAG: tRNA (adenosine(37)-N6)-dimethylallyltransferase MiaA [Bellilinea sp.]|jgi:tRNA dimethylallyltransferase
MCPHNQKKRVVVIVGPTAVGKTDTAIHLAERFNGEIVSADSRLFYRDMNIGTAKPTTDDLKRVVHHLVDVADADEAWSLGTFKQAAQQAIENIHARGRLPFVVGGTGQYITALVENWLVPAQQADLTLRQALENWAAEIGYDALHARLALLDPAASGRIDARNVRRTIRALEVIFKTGERFSAQRKKGISPYQVLKIGLQRPRSELYQRIDRRIEGMLQAGLVNEVQTLLEKFPASCPAFSAIGYREIIEYIQGSISLPEAVEKIKRATRQFVRRQANWFKAEDAQIHWFGVEEDSLAQIECLIGDWLKKEPEE